MDIKPGQVWIGRYGTVHEVIEQVDAYGFVWKMRGPSGNLYRVTAHDLFEYYELKG